MTGPISILEGERGGSYSQSLVAAKTRSYFKPVNPGWVQYSDSNWYKGPNQVKVFLYVNTSLKITDQNLMCHPSQPHAVSQLLVKKSDLPS